MVGPGAYEPLVEFSFVSRVCPDLQPAVFLRLARQSWNFNVRIGLTGTLHLVDGRFEQTVEGPCSFIMPLAARILGDARHTAIRITAFGPLEARRFVSWSVRGFDFIDDPEDRANAGNLRFLPVAQPGPLARRAAAPGLRGTFGRGLPHA